MIKNNLDKKCSIQFQNKVFTKIKLTENISAKNNYAENIFTKCL